MISVGRSSSAAAGRGCVGGAGLAGGGVGALGVPELPGDVGVRAAAGGLTGEG